MKKFYKVLFILWVVLISISTLDLMLLSIDILAGALNSHYGKVVLFRMNEVPVLNVVHNICIFVFMFGMIGVAVLFFMKTRYKDLINYLFTDDERAMKVVNNITAQEYVQEKHVDYEVETVERGATGININKS